MLNNKLIFLFLLLGFFILTTCKEVEKVMMVTTGAVNDITYNTAVVSGQIVDIGEGATQYGHYYSTTANETSSGLKTQFNNPSGKKEFTSQLTELKSGTKYYIKAYISDGAITVYGKEMSFSTISASLPTLSTNSIISITTTTATSGGNISTDGGANVTTRGVCWNLSSNPTITSSKTNDGNGTGSFISNLTGLTAGTIYFVRAYATNSAGTAYGNELTFTTNAVTPGLPTLSTTTVTSITQTTATSGGNITNDGGASIISRGVCWNTTANPTITNSKTSDLTGTGSFISNLTGLTAGTTYFVRAYATNSAGTAYGNELIFNTPLPTPTITNFQDIVKNYGDSPFAITPPTSNSTGAFTYTCSNVSVVTIDANSGTITIIGAGTATITATQAPTASFTSGTIDATLTINAVLPTISTSSVTNIASSTASSGGNVTNNGGTALIVRGVCWNTSPNPVATIGNYTTDGSVIGAFISSITGLTPNTLYYIRAYATNSVGTVYGSNQSFTTLCVTPTATTVALTSIHNTTASLRGIVNPNGCSATVIFEYGLTDMYGSYITAFESPVSGSSLTNVSAYVTGLTSGQTYHYRVNVSSSGGISYGSDMTFTTTMQDEDGNNYTSVNIGTQVWMRENLKTTRFNNGSFITNVTDNTTWNNIDTQTAYYCWYNNDAATYKNLYGALYNFFAVKAGNLCPSGWHVPSDDEWHTLVLYLDPTAILNTTESTSAGDKLKESGTIHWASPNAGTNESGFTALPGGYRGSSGFVYVGNTTGWWSTKTVSGTFTWTRSLHNNNSSVIRQDQWQWNGWSVRCLRD